MRLVLETIAVHVLVLVIMMLAVSAAWAQDAPQGGELLFNDARNCGPTAKVYERLTNRYEEFQVATLDMGEEGITVLFVNHLKETWTLLSVRPDGLTCVRAWGNGLHLALGEPT